MFDEDGSLRNLDLEARDPSAGGGPTVPELEAIWGPARTPPRSGPGAANRRVFIPKLGPDSPLFLMISADVAGWPTEPADMRVSRISFGLSRL